MTLVEARIDTVEVFREGAAVYRRIELKGPLPEELLIPDLPLSLLDGSARLWAEAIEGEGDLLPLELAVELRARPRAERPEPPQEAELRALEQRAERLERRRELLQAEVRLLDGIEIPARPQGKEGQAPPPSPLEARLALSGLCDELSSSRQQELIEVAAEEREVALAIADCRQRLAQLGSAHKVSQQLLSKAIRVRLAISGTPTGARLVLRYQVPGARWIPRYQCRIAADGSSARIQLRAALAQDSGEDWRGVRLLLSTADPLGWCGLPELSAIRIGRAQPAPQKNRGLRPPPAGAEALFADYDRDRGRSLRLVPSPPSWTAPRLRPAPLLSLALAAPVLEVAESEEEDDYAFAEEVAEPEPAAESMSMDFMPAAGSAFGGAMTESPAPPPRKMMRSRARKKRKGGHKERMSKLEMEAPEEAEAGAGGLPRFDRLRLPGAVGRARGRLLPVEQKQAYEAALRTQGVEVDLDVAQVVAAAATRAARVSGLAAPADSRGLPAADSRFDYSYRADTRVDVAADGGWHTVTLATREAGCRLDYVVVPREDSGVYRRARIENPLDAPLLPGPAEVYVGGSYVLTTTLPVVAPRASFELGIGVEQAIRCVRNTRFSEGLSGARVVATRELAHEIRIELVNQLDRSVEIEVRERIPQPAKGAEVVVEEGAVTPPWEPWEQRGALRRWLKGGRRWRVPVEARGTVELSADYVIKIYARNEVVGGDRRER